MKKPDENIRLFFTIITRRSLKRASPSPENEPDNRRQTQSDERTHRSAHNFASGFLRFLFHDTTLLFYYQQK